MILWRLYLNQESDLKSRNQKLKSIRTKAQSKSTTEAGKTKFTKSTDFS